MYLRHLGYACQNLTLGRTTGKTFRLASLSPERVAETVAANLDALGAILRWNVEHGIRFFRVSSDAVPFASHRAFAFDYLTHFRDEFAALRAYAQEHDVRLSMHPGQFTVLSSPRPEVVEAALAELEYQAAFLHALDPDDGTLTLHVGGAYGDKASALERFAQNFARLSDRAKGMLILENDDKVYAATEVLPLCEALGVPMVFDAFHHKVHHTAAGPEVGLHHLLERVVATWNGKPPKFHLSSPREGGPKTAHADEVTPEDLDAFTGLMDTVGGDGPYDVMLEAKRKDCAVLPLLARRAAVPAAG